MSRPRIHASNAEKQRAYRERQPLPAFKSPELEQLCKLHGYIMAAARKNPAYKQVLGKNARQTMDLIVEEWRKVAHE